MNYLRPILSLATVVFLCVWSRLLLPLRKEPMPFSGWGDGAGGNAATMEGPVMLFWLATMFAFVFIGIKPYFQKENGLTRLGRWLANLIFFPLAIALLFYARHGPSVRFLLVYGFVALMGLWVYVDVRGGVKQRERNDPP